MQPQLSRDFRFKYLFTNGTNWISKVFTLEEIANGEPFEVLSDSPLLKHYKHVKTLEWTGFKDIKGAEIFEGDFLGGFPHGAVLVRWCDRFACFEAYWIQLEYDEGDIESKIETTSLFANEYEECNDAWEVLGNQYQNPKLFADITS